jgi:3-oxoadipate enol-lactonase
MIWWKKMSTLLLLTGTAALAQQPGAKPVPHHPGGFVEVEGGNLYYEECGSGPQTVLLVHDGILHSAAWDEVWPEFCKSFHVVRYDRRGFGRSPTAKTWYSETDDVLAVLRKVGVKQAVVVGSSHGGELSLNFTLEHPDHVQQLVLVGAVVTGMPYSDYFFDRGNKNSEPMEKKDVQGMLKNWAYDQYLIAPDHPQAKKKLLDLLTASPQDMTHEDWARPTRSAVERLAEIKVPTLILVGDADIADVLIHAGAIEAGIPQSRLMVIHDAGHLMYLEKPDEFTQTVIQFILRNSAW